MDEGHEIGCHGYDHKTLTVFSENEIERKLEKASAILAGVSKTFIEGFRAPNFFVEANIVRILEKLGYKYDSSVLPCLPIPGWHGFARAPLYPYHPNLARLQREDSNESFWEFPLAVFPQVRFPCYGGWWLRNVGKKWFLTGLKLLLRRGPATVCFHDWEFLEKHNIRVPSKFKAIPSIPYLAFRNTGKYMFDALVNLLTGYDAKFMSGKMATESGMFT